MRLPGVLKGGVYLLFKICGWWHDADELIERALNERTDNKSRDRVCRKYKNQSDNGVKDEPACTANFRFISLREHPEHTAIDNKHQEDNADNAERGINNRSDKLRDRYVGYIIPRVGCGRNQSRSS